MKRHNLLNGPSAQSIKGFREKLNELRQNDPDNDRIPELEKKADKLELQMPVNFRQRLIETFRGDNKTKKPAKKSIANKETQDVPDKNFLRKHPVLSSLVLLAILSILSTKLLVEKIESTREALRKSLLGTAKVEAGGETPKIAIIQAPRDCSSLRFALEGGEIKIKDGNGIFVSVTSLDGYGISSYPPGERWTLQRMTFPEGRSPDDWVDPNGQFHGLTIQIKGKMYDMSDRLPPIKKGDEIILFLNRVKADSPDGHLAAQAEGAFDVAAWCTSGEN